MLYTSTRGTKGLVTSAFAIQKGLADDGGLYLPVHIPVLSREEILNLCQVNYSDRALKILSFFLTDFNESELNLALAQAYNGDKFKQGPAPLHIVNNQTGILELWHGPTAAFKDVALQLLPQLLPLTLLVAHAQKFGENIFAK